jgi:hypothetical protein
MNSNNSLKEINKHKIESSINNFFENNYFDIQGLTPGIKNFDEQYLAKVLTKLAIGSATVWWSLLEVKDFLSLRRKKNH